MARESEIVLREKSRAREILESPEGQRNPTLARSLVFDSLMSSAAARDLLAKAPAENPYLAALDREVGSNPVVGAEGAPSGYGSDPKAARLSEIQAVAKSFNARNRKG